MGTKESKILKGWYITRWGDGSGCLVDDKGMKRGSYDAATGEIDTGHGYEFFAMVSEASLIGEIERVHAVSLGVITLSDLAAYHDDLGVM